MKKLTAAQMKKRPCSACGKPVGTATIVCGGRYPNAQICAECFYLDDLENVIAHRALLGTEGK